MSPQDSCNSAENGNSNSSTGKTSENNYYDDATEHIHHKNETNLANLNLKKKKNRTNMDNNLRYHASPDAIIGVMTSLIGRGYRGTDLIAELRRLINQLEFVSPPVIRSNKFYL